MRSSLSHLLGALSLCVVSIVLYGMWYTAVSAKSIAAGNLQSTIDEKIKTANQVTTTRAAFANIADEEAAIHAYFVPQMEVSTFIDTLKKYAETLGTTLETPSISVSGTLIQPTLSFTIVVRGTFTAVMRTVGAIEYAPYDLIIPTLSITKDTENGWHADLKLVVGSVSAASVVTSTSTASSTATSSYAHF